MDHECQDAQGEKTTERHEGWPTGEFQKKIEGKILLKIGKQVAHTNEFFKRLTFIWSQLTYFLFCDATKN